MGFWGVPKGRGGSSKLNNSTEFIHFKEHWSTTNFSPWYCWWFRNPASTSWGNGSSSHHLRRVFMTIPSTVAWPETHHSSPFGLMTIPWLHLGGQLKEPVRGWSSKWTKITTPGDADSGIIKNGKGSSWNEQTESNAKWWDDVFLQRFQFLALNDFEHTSFRTSYH